MSRDGASGHIPARDWIAVFGAILGAFMAVLDILFTGNDPVLAQLRPGLSVTTTVDTRTKPPQSAETLVPPGSPPGSR